MYDPEQYDSFKKLSFRPFTESPVSKLMNGVTWKKNETILDYGCGTGTMTNKRLVPIATIYDSFVHCVDISDKMIEYAKRTYPGPNIEYLVGNIISESFPFQNEYFDKVFAIHVFNWIPDFRVGLRKVYNLLKPGGYFGFLVGSGGFFQNKLLFSIARDPEWAEYMQGYEEFKYMTMYDFPDVVENSYRDTIQEIGFKILDFKTITEGKDPVTMRRLVGFYISLNPYVHKIPKSKRKELEHSYLKHLNTLLGADSDKKLDDLVSHEHTLLYAIVQK